MDLSSIQIKGYSSTLDNFDRSKRQSYPLTLPSTSSEEGGQLRKLYWEFMKKTCDWKSVYLRGTIGDTLLAYVPPGISRKTNFIQNLECFSQLDFEMHLSENRALMLTWWELWEQLSSKGWVVRSTNKEGDVFEFTWAAVKENGVTSFSCKLALMQYIGRFPYPLQTPSQLAVSLKRHGWSIYHERTGLVFEEPGTKTAYTYDSLVRNLFQRPTLFFAYYLHQENQQGIESRILEAIKTDSNVGSLDFDNQESLYLAAIDNGTWTMLRKILDSYNQASLSGHTTMVSEQLSLLAEILPLLGWKTGPVEKEELPSNTTVWWKYMNLYRPPYIMYNQHAKFPVTSANMDDLNANALIFGRDFFFDLEHVATLLLHNIDYVCTLRPPFSLVQEINSSPHFCDYSKGEVGKEYLRYRVARFFINYPTQEEIQQARETKQLDETLRVLGWQIFPNRLGVDIFIPPTSGRAQRVTKLNYHCFTKGAHYYDDVDQVGAYFLAQEEAMNKQHTFRTAFSTTQSTPASSPDTAQEKISPFKLARAQAAAAGGLSDSAGLILDFSQSSTISKPISSVAIVKENVVIAERDCFYWQSLKVFAKEKLHGEILGALVRLGWGHYLLEGRQEAIIYCVPEMTEELTEKHIPVGTRLRRRDYSSYDRGESYFFDLTDADKLYEKVQELISDDGNLALHARSRQRYFREFNPGKEYPGLLNVDDSKDFTMLPMVVSTFGDVPSSSSMHTIHRRQQLQQLQQSPGDTSTATPTSTLSMDTQGPRQKISAFYDFAILHTKKNYKFRYGDVMPILKRIGWDVKYLDQRAILLSPRLRHDLPFQKLCTAESSSLDKVFFRQLERDGIIRQGVDYFYEDMETEQICYMASRLIPEDVLLQHMPPADARRRKRRQMGLDSDDDEEDMFFGEEETDEHVNNKKNVLMTAKKNVKEIVVNRNKNPVSPLSDDEAFLSEQDVVDDMEEEEEESDSETMDDAGIEEIPDADENDANLSLDEKYAHLELIELFKQEKKSFAVILNMAKVLGWKTLHYKRELSFICAPDVADAAMEKGLCESKIYVKPEFMQIYQQGKDFFDTLNEREEFYNELERRIPPHLYSFLLPSQKAALSKNSNSINKNKTQISKKSDNEVKKDKKMSKNVIDLDAPVKVNEKKIKAKVATNHFDAMDCDSEEDSKEVTMEVVEDNKENDTEMRLPLYFSPERDSDAPEYGLYKELAFCLQEEPIKYAHILCILIDFGWKKVYCESDCYILTPELVKICEENNWYKDAKKVYVKKELIRAYEFQSNPKVLYRESLDKHELFEFLIEEVKRYKQSLPLLPKSSHKKSVKLIENALVTSKKASHSKKMTTNSQHKTPASAMIRKDLDFDEPSTFQQKFRQQDIAPLSADTASSVYFASLTQSSSISSKSKKVEGKKSSNNAVKKTKEVEETMIDPSLTVMLSTDPVVDIWSIVRNELVSPAPRYGVIAGCLKSLGWLSVYMNDTSTMCTPEMLSLAKERGYIAKNTRKMKNGTGKEFIRFQDYFVETEDSVEFFQFLQKKVNAFFASVHVIQVPSPASSQSLSHSQPHSRSQSMDLTHQFQSKAKHDHIQMKDHPSTTRQLNGDLHRMALQTSNVPDSITIATDEQQHAPLKRRTSSSSMPVQKTKLTVMSSPAQSISTIDSSELSVTDRLRHLLFNKKTPIIRFSKVFDCLKSLGWEKKWFRAEAYLCNPQMLHILKTEELVSGVYLHKNALSSFQKGKDYFHEVDQKQELYTYLKSIADENFACEEPALQMPTRSPVYPVRGWEDPSEAMNRLTSYIGENDDDNVSRMSEIYEVQFVDESVSSMSKSKYISTSKEQPSQARKLFLEEDEDLTSSTNQKNNAMDEEFILDLDADVFNDPGVSHARLRQPRIQTKNHEEEDNDDLPVSQVQCEDTLPCNMDVIASDWFASTQEKQAHSMHDNDNIINSKYDVAQWPEAQDEVLKDLLKQPTVSIEKVYVHLRNGHRWHRQFMRKAPGIRYLLSADYVTFRAGRNYGQQDLIENVDYFVDEEEMKRVLMDVCGVVPLEEENASLRHSISGRNRKRTNNDQDNVAVPGYNVKRPRRERVIPIETAKKPLKRQLTLDEELDMLGDDRDSDEDNDSATQSSVYEEQEDNFEKEEDRNDVEEHEEAPVEEDESTWSLQKYISVAQRRLIAHSGGDNSLFPVPQREEESFSIFDTISRHLTMGKGGIVHVVGSPGTGKTLTVHSTARQVMSLLRHMQLPNTINGADLVNFAFTTGGIEDTSDVLFSIADQINFTIPSQCQTKAEKVQAIIDRLKRPATRVPLTSSSSSSGNYTMGMEDTASVVSGYSRKSSMSHSSGGGTVPMTVLIIDEITDFRPNTLRELLSIAAAVNNGSHNSSLLIVATGNETLLNDTSVIRPAMAKGVFKQIVFKPYERDRLLGIIQARAGLLFVESAALFIAAKVIRNENSDPRKLLERCHQAVTTAADALQNAGQDLSAIPVKPIVTVPVVMAMFGQVDAAKLTKFDSLLPYQRTMIIGLLIAGYEMNGSSTRAFTVQEAHDAYHNYLAELNIDGEISLDSIAHYLQEICAYGFVLPYRENMKRAPQVGQFGVNLSLGMQGQNSRYVMQISVEMLLKSQTLAQEVERKFLLRYQQEKKTQAIRDEQMRAQGIY